jgi:hypothetical protein
MNARRRQDADAEVVGFDAQVKTEQDAYKKLRTDPRFPSGRYARPTEVTKPRGVIVSGESNCYEYQPRGTRVKLGYFTIYSYEDNGTTYEKATSEGVLDLSYDWREREVFP